MSRTTVFHHIENEKDEPAIFDLADCASGDIILGIGGLTVFMTRNQASELAKVLAEGLPKLPNRKRPTAPGQDTPF